MKPVPRELEYRDQLLEALNRAADILLKADEGEFEAALVEGLGLVAACADIDRVNIWRREKVEGGNDYYLKYKWANGLVQPEAPIYKGMRFPYTPAWEDLFSRREYLNGPLSGLSPADRDMLLPYNIKSILIIPIFLHDHFWGHITFDDCRRERVFTESEASLLRFMALTMANAISRTEEEGKVRRMIREIERRNQILHALNNMADIMLQSNTGSFESTLHSCMGTIAETVNVDRVYIWKNHVVDGELYCTQVHEWSKGAAPQQGNEYTIDIPYRDNIPGWEETLSQGKCISSLVRDMSPEEQAQLSPQGIFSILVVPVFLQDQFWGFAGVDDCRNERVFSEDEEMILRAASQLVANAMIRNEMERAVAEQNELNRVMFDAAPAGLSIFEDDFRVLDCNDALLALHGVSRQFYIDHFFELSPEYQPDGSKSRESALEMLERVLDGEKLTLEWMHCSPAGEPIPCEVTMSRTHHNGKYIGLAYVSDLRKTKKLEKTIQRLETEADKIFYDPLTGIYNRRFFDENLKRIIKSLSRSGGLLSLIMIDIDHFKGYNDHYGHMAGDDCLKEVAATLTGTITRGDDFVARYGGEEFVVVLPNTGEGGARLIAEKLLENIRNRNIPHEKNEAADRVTVSIGVAFGHVDHTQSGDDYIKRADEMLYASKQGGRNRYSLDTLS
jgi:diguanylate cyclase (GGDEF)-like protein